MLFPVLVLSNAMGLNRILTLIIISMVCLSTKQVDEMTALLSLLLLLLLLSSLLSLLLSLLLFYGIYLVCHT